MDLKPCFPSPSFLGVKAQLIWIAI